MKSIEFFSSKITSVIIKSSDDFLSDLESNFRKLSENLNTFLGNLNSEKLDTLIENKTLLLKN